MKKTSFFLLFLFFCYFFDLRASHLDDVLSKNDSYSSLSYFSTQMLEKVSDELSQVLSPFSAQSLSSNQSSEESIDTPLMNSPFFLDPHGCGFYCYTFIGMGKRTMSIEQKKMNFAQEMHEIIIDCLKTSKILKKKHMESMTWDFEKILLIDFKKSSDPLITSTPNPYHLSLHYKHSMPAPTEEGSKIGLPLVIKRLPTQKMGAVQRLGHYYVIKLKDLDHIRYSDISDILCKKTILNI